MVFVLVIPSDPVRQTCATTNRRHNERFLYSRARYTEVYSYPLIKARFMDLKLWHVFEYFETIYRSYQRKVSHVLGC